MRISKMGIWFIHAKNHPIHCDEVCWIYPWRKADGGRRFLSMGFNGSFKSLKELDKLWEKYCKAVSS